MKSNNSIIYILLTLATLFTAYLIFRENIGEFDLRLLKDNHQKLLNFYSGSPIKLISIYFILYVFIATFSLPLANLMTITGGAIFGLFTGTIITSFASTIGATLAFLLSRNVFRQWLSFRFHKSFSKINAKFEEQGPYYLFSLRMIPIMPFFLINLGMGVTSIKTWTYYWVSQLGMLLGTFIYVNAGDKLSKVHKISDIVTPTIFLSLILIGLAPVIGKKIITAFTIKGKTNDRPN